MADKRSALQLEFDLAKHGWAFCNDDMLRGKVEQLIEITQKGDVGKRRLDTLEFIRSKVKA